MAMVIGGPLRVSSLQSLVGFPRNTDLSSLVSSLDPTQTSFRTHKPATSVNSSILASSAAIQHHMKKLFHKNHFLYLNEFSRFKPAKIHIAGDLMAKLIGAIPWHLEAAGRFHLIDQNSHPLSQQIEDGYLNMVTLRQMIPDDRLWIKGIGIILL